MNPIDDLHNPTTQDPAMRTAHLTVSTSAAALSAAFPRGPRIAFAPETGAGSGRNPKAITPDAIMSGGVMVNPGKKDTVRNDAAEAAPEGDNMSKLMALMQTIVEQQAATNTRMDAMEAKAKEGATKDPDDLTEAEKEEAAKADGMLPPGTDRAMADIRGRMGYAERHRAERAQEEALAKVQIRADAAASLHGRRAPAPMSGETLDAYKVRCLKEHQKFSPAYKAVDLGVIARAEPAAFAAIEDQIFADSAEASKRPEGPEDGGFTVRTKVDPHSGQRTNEFFGRSTFVKHLTPPTRHVRSFNTTGQPLQHVFSA